MIDKINSILLATNDVFILESGLIEIIDEIESAVNGGKVKLVICSSQPLCGISSAIDYFSSRSSSSIVKIRPDIYTNSPGFFDRLIESFGMATQGADTKHIPKYLIELMRYSARKIIVMDDIDLFWQSAEELENFRESLSEVFKFCESSCAVITTKNAKTASFLYRYSEVKYKHIIFPQYPNLKSAERFAADYVQAVSSALNWQASLSGKVELGCMSLGVLARSIHAAMVVAYLRNERVFDLNISPRDTDDYVLKGYLEATAFEK